MKSTRGGDAVVPIEILHPVQRIILERLDISSAIGEGLEPADGVVAPLLGAPDVGVVLGISEFLFAAHQIVLVGILLGIVELDQAGILHGVEEVGRAGGVIIEIGHRGGLGRLGNPLAGHPVHGVEGLVGDHLAVWAGGCFQAA